MVAATIRTIFAQPSGKQVREQLDNVAGLLRGEFPAVAELLLNAKADLTAFADFPLPHWQKDLVHQPPRTAQPRGQATHRRRRDLPQQRRSAAARCLRPDRSPRRMARQRPPLPVRRLHAAAHPATADRSRACEDTAVQDPQEAHRRYGIVALTRREPREELHHPRGRGHTRCQGDSRTAGQSHDHGCRSRV